MKKTRSENTLLSMLRYKCPRCRTGRMFLYPTWHLRHLLKMHQKCPSCGQDFMIEPGFYFGAMYFSYAINIAIMVFFGVAVEVLFNPDRIWITLASVLIPPILLSPWNFRLSRVLMIYSFGGIRRSDKEKIEQK